MQSHSVLERVANAKSKWSPDSARPSIMFPRLTAQAVEKLDLLSLSIHSGYSREHIGTHLHLCAPSLFPVNGFYLADLSIVQPGMSDGWMESSGAWKTYSKHTFVDMCGRLITFTDVRAVPSCFIHCSPNYAILPVMFLVSKELKMLFSDWLLDRHKGIRRANPITRGIQNTLSHSEHRWQENWQINSVWVFALEREI